MPPLLAITHPQLYLPTKRDALLFDTIGIVSLHAHRDRIAEHVAADFEWLAEKGIVRDCQFNLSFSARLDATPAEIEFETIVAEGIVCEILKLAPDFADLIDHILRPSFVRGLIERSHVARNIDHDRTAVLSNKILRLVLNEIDIADPVACRALSETFSSAASERTVRLMAYGAANHNAVPLLPDLSRALPPWYQPQNVDVAKIVLAALPTPTDDTPWEDIVAFRDDQDARRALTRLRHWMTRACREKKTAFELTDELEVLLEEYRSYLRLHHIKTQYSLIEAVVLLTAEFAEHLAHLRFGEMAKMLFRIGNYRTDLLAAEQVAPGREVAYIAKARYQFGEPNVRL